MAMKRREFIGTALGAGVVAAAGTMGGRAQGAQAPPAPKRSTAKVEKLWNLPAYKYMNALESAPDGLWIGDQVTEKVCRVDWNTGKILHEVQCESHNISGLAVGGGYIWAGSNGSVNNRRPPRPTDREYGEFAQLDMKTGKIVKVSRPVWETVNHQVKRCVYDRVVETVNQEQCYPVCEPVTTYRSGRPRCPFSAPRRWIRRTTCASCACSGRLDSVRTASTWTRIISGCCFRPTARSTSTNSAAGE